MKTDNRKPCVFKCQIQGHHASAVPLDMLLSFSVLVWKVLPTDFILLLEPKHTHTRHCSQRRAEKPCPMSRLQHWLSCFFFFFQFMFFCMMPDRRQESHTIPFPLVLPVLSEGQNVKSRRDHRAKNKARKRSAAQLGSTFHKAIVMTVSLWQLSCWKCELRPEDWAPSEHSSSDSTFCLITPSTGISFPLWCHSSPCNVVIF